MQRQDRVYLILLICCLLGLSLTGAALPTRASEAATTGCVELLQDGSFEAGGQGWLQYSAQGYELISDFNPRTGRLGAYLAGVNSADDRLSQQIALPAGVSTVRAWWYLATAETAGAFDQMTVALLRPDGSWLADLVTVDNTAPVGVWDELVIDLSPHAGQTVVLRFTGRADDTNISDFYLDDISLMACATDPQPTTTATVTPSVTAPNADPDCNTGIATVTPRARPWGDADCDRHPDCRTPTLTNTGVAHGDAQCHLAPWGDADCDRHPDCFANANPDRNTGIAHGDAQCHLAPWGDADCDRHPDCHNGAEHATHLPALHHPVKGEIP